MTYLSRLLLDPRSRAVMHDLADCHSMHRTLLSAFPQAPSEAGTGARDYFGILYRLEPDRRSGVGVIVQSSVRPDWSRLPDGYLLDSEENPVCKRVDEAYGKLRNGTILRFRLRANPTKRVWNTGEPGHERWKGKRVELQREEDQLAWLCRKGTLAGFELISYEARHDGVLDVQAAPGPKTYGRKGAGGMDGRRLTFGSVLFDGRLRVTDAERFRKALVEGIGSGKAYGFGLLSVAPDR